MRTLSVTAALFFGINFIEIGCIVLASFSARQDACSLESLLTPGLESLRKNRIRVAYDHLLPEHQAA
jgi:hypothetical protein